MIFIAYDKEKTNSNFSFVSVAATAPEVATPVIKECHGTQFDFNRFVCCDEFEICPRSMRKCCGKHCYSVGASLCCEGRIIDKCNQFNSACCGQVCIDLSKKACRDGVIVEACAGPESAWCGDTCFDKSSHLCCNGKIIARCGYDRATADCCGRECYNTKTDSCCNGQIINPKCTADCCGSTCCKDDSRR